MYTTAASLAEEKGGLLDYCRSYLGEVKN